MVGVVLTHNFILKFVALFFLVCDFQSGKIKEEKKQDRKCFREADASY